MSETTNSSDLARLPVVYQLPGMKFANVGRNIVYRADEASVQTMDVYSPPGAQPDARLPAVVFITGYPDAGAQKFFGCKLKDMASYVSWGQLVAASGMVAITYTNRDPAADVYDVLDYAHHVRQSPDGATLF